MKTLIEYIKENLDIDNFSYKFDVWFKSDKQNYQPMLKFLQECYQKKIVQKDDIEQFLTKNNTFKLKKFVDFFDEDVKRDESINIDYIYQFTKIIEHFISNLELFNKVDYKYQALQSAQDKLIKNGESQ